MSVSLRILWFQRVYDKEQNLATETIASLEKDLSTLEKMQKESVLFGMMVS